MQIVKSSSGKAKVLIGSKPMQYYFRGDKGGLVNRNLGPTPKDWEYSDSLVSHQADLVMVLGNQEPMRYMTLGSFYENELFYELWFIPLSSLLLNEGKKGVEEAPGRMTPGVVSTFLMRGQSMESFQDLIQEIEMQVFIEKQNENLDSEEMQQAIMQASLNSIYTFKAEPFETEYGTKYMMRWSRRLAESDVEKAYIECANTITQQYSHHLINPVVEQAVLKARGCDRDGVVSAAFAHNGVVEALPASIVK